MAPLLIDFGRSRVERRTLALTRADKDRILQNFPEKIAVAVPGFGPQDYPLRPHVKAFLDAVQLPSAKLTFEVEGNGVDAELTLIENPQLKVIGVTGGEFVAGETTVAYRFDADVETDGIELSPCKGAEGHDGLQPSRRFRLVWDIEIEISPGVGGLFEVDETEIVVTAPGCFPPAGEDTATAAIPATAAREKKKKKRKRRD